MTNNKDCLLVSGKVIKPLGASTFLVQCENGKIITANITAEFRRKRREYKSIRITQNDRLIIKMNLNDFTKGDITKNKSGDELMRKIVLGLEIHITLNSEKKIFNWENTYKGEGLPNSLKLATALEMKISPIILFDRKIYNYFDLPKGYQITQQETPLATAGYLPIIKENKITKIPIKVLQLEEDTAKSTYSQEGVKLDFNRAGNPLIELVTEPVFQQVETVLIFIKQLQNLLRYLDISQAKMEQGQLRIDLNYSLQLENSYSTPRYEIKNLNSLANIEKALKWEITKHELLFSQGQEPPASQTLGFDETKQITITHRQKTDYFYLPEVNIPPLKLTSRDSKKIKKEKKLDNEEINSIIRELKETPKNFALLVKSSKLFARTSQAKIPGLFSKRSSDNQIKELQTEINHLKTEKSKPTSEDIEKITEFSKELSITDSKLTAELQTATSYQELFNIQHKTFKAKLASEVISKNMAKNMNYCLGTHWRLSIVNLNDS
ncbi:10198_t:CDS:2 [Entrophospora sp. SA101]|nr:10198_t:CDS:2 [Entrophospora sp. SA101]